MRDAAIHFFKPYSAACLNRGSDGRPKTVQFGGVERGRVSSASLKRALRTSSIFADSFEENLGTRTRHLGNILLDRIAPENGRARTNARKAVRSIIRGGAADESESEVAADDDEPSEKKKKIKALGKVKDASTLQMEQLIFIDEREIARAESVARRIIAGEKVPTQDIQEVITHTTVAADVALFGRMFADRSDLQMLSAAQVAHPFTVGRAMVEEDYFVAVDDRLPPGDAGTGFLGEQGFVSGLFYGYARIDLDVLSRNLGGDVEVAKAATKAFIKGILEVSPSGKVASFGSHSKATWAMLELGHSSPRSLAGAFMEPVEGGNHHQEAVTRALALADNMKRAYDEDFERTVMNVVSGEGSLSELLAAIDCEG